MAEREAAIRLTLDDGQFVAGMGKAGDAAVKSAQRSERAIKVFGAGVEKATSSVKSLGSTAQSALGMVSGLLGGLTVGSALKGAVELDSKFKQLAFRVSIATREQVKHTDLLKMAEAAAAKTGRRTVEMGDAYDQLFTATGDKEFAQSMLFKIGEAATATGQEISTLTSLADQMHTKFGVAADDMGDVFAQVFEAAQMGGPSFQEFADVASNMGAELLNAGFDGRRGLDFMLGALVKTDDAMGNLQKQVKGIKQILLSLGDTKQITAIAKALHIDPKKLLNEKDLMGRMKRILGLGKKGLDAIKASMTEAEEQKALKILFTDPFEAALKDANESGLKGKAAIDAALVVLDEQINAFGKSAITGSHFQDEANKRREDPERRLTAALDRLQMAFGDPKIIAAIDELSKHLPKIADAFGKFAKFVVQNPILSATLGVGAKAGSGFLQGAIGEAITEAFTGGGRRGGGAGAGGGIGGRGSLIERHHQFLGEGISEAQMIENSIEQGGVKAGSAISTAMKLGAVAAAAAWVYELGKEAMDSATQGSVEANRNSAVVLGQTASMRGGLEKQKADAEALRAAIAQQRAESGGFFKTFFGAMVHGAGAQVDEMGNPTGVIDAAASGAPDWQGTLDRQTADLEQQLKEKEALIAKLESEQGAPGAPGAAVDGKAVGKAVADTLKQGQPLTVHVANMPQGGVPAGKAGPGGSRGPKRPAAQASGSGL